MLALRYIKDYLLVLKHLLFQSNKLNLLRFFIKSSIIPLRIKNGNIFV